MSAQSLSFTKVSQLPATTQISDSDVIIVNHNGVTSKMLYSDFKNLIQSDIDAEVDALTTRVSTLENTCSSLATRVATLEATVNNIITASFNLIGIDAPAKKN
jgi:hypothetical protein